MIHRSAALLLPIDPLLRTEQSADVAQGLAGSQRHHPDIEMTGDVSPRAEAGLQKLGLALRQRCGKQLPSLTEPTPMHPVRSPAVGRRRRALVGAPATISEFYGASHGCLCAAAARLMRIRLCSRGDSAAFATPIPANGMQHAPARQETDSTTRQRCCARPLLSLPASVPADPRGALPTPCAILRLSRRGHTD